MGLTEKALGELVELGSEGLADDASDEDIEKKVDSLVPFAKAMQAEITRKTQKSNQPRSNLPKTEMVTVRAKTRATRTCRNGSNRR